VPKQYVLDIVERIARFDPVTPQLRQTAARQQERERLNHIWAVANELVDSIGGLHGHAPDVARQLGVGGLMTSLVRLRDDLDQRRLPLPPSGGRRAERINKARKQLSAFSAYYLLRRPDVGVVPDLEGDGPYITLTEAFFNIATGTEPNLYQVCRLVLRWHEDRTRRLYEALNPGRRVRFPQRRQE
jgi:hypothetical protein